MAAPRLTQLVLECADVERSARFWRELLELPEEAEGDADWLTLCWAPVGRLSFHRVDGYRPPEWPGASGQQQAHLDLLVDDLPASCRAAERAGARPLTDVLDPGPRSWRVYADPAGHPFCLVSVPE